MIRPKARPEQCKSTMGENEHMDHQMRLDISKLLKKRVLNNFYQEARPLNVTRHIQKAKTREM